MLALKKKILDEFHYKPNKIAALIAGLFKKRNKPLSTTYHGTGQNLVLANFKADETRMLKGFLHRTDLTDQSIVDQLTNFADNLYKARHGEKVDKKVDLLTFRSVTGLSRSHIHSINQSLNRDCNPPQINDLIKKREITVQFSVSRGFEPGSCEKQLAGIINDFLNNSESQSITNEHREALKRVVNRLSQYYELDDVATEAMVIENRYNLDTPHPYMPMH